MSVYLYRSVFAFFITCSFFSTFPALAEGGISIKGTRIIYPSTSVQENVSVFNSSSKDSFLVQSWVEDAQGRKTQDYIVTPPLYLSGPNNENTLRLTRTSHNTPHDRESLYYFIAKAIPPVDSKDSGSANVMRISAASRIKLIVRPKGLSPTPDKAPLMLKFTKVGNQLKINNPTPYFITLTKIKSGVTKLRGFMVPPMQQTNISLPPGFTNNITFSTINDSGALSQPVTLTVK